MNQESCSLGIMQPYFLPYLGYWQILNYVDTYVVYDKIKYTKKGWFNRNRYLQQGQAATFTIPLKKASDSAFIVDREIADDFNRKKLLAQLDSAYHKAPFFNETWPLIEAMINDQTNNAFHFIFNSILSMCSHLNITTKIVVSSNIPIDLQEFGPEDKVLALCKHFKAETYINPPGGVDLYQQDSFDKAGILLRFLKADLNPYPQFGNEYIPGLSVLDVLMFNGASLTKKLLNEFTMESLVA